MPWTYRWPATVVYEGPKDGPQSVVGRDINITLRLEVYRTDQRGWGVRCWDAISPGTFVAPFTGEIFTSDTAEERNRAARADLEGTEAWYEMMEYQFDLEVSCTIPNPATRSALPSTLPSKLPDPASCALFTHNP